MSAVPARTTSHQPMEGRLVNLARAALHDLLAYLARMLWIHREDTE